MLEDHRSLRAARRRRDGRSKWLGAAMLVLATTCAADPPGTSVDVSLQYDDALGLDTVDVTLPNRTQSGRIAHHLFLLVPDELAGTQMPIEVWARKSGNRAAYGTGNVLPKLGATVATSLALTACTPACQVDMLNSCTEPVVACALGCSEDGDPHCIALMPSNGVDASIVDPLRETTTIAANTTFNVDTGEITGGLVRAAGTGVVAEVGYFQVPASGSGGAPLAIFAFHSLTIEAAATVQFTGTRAVVLLIGDAARIAGTIDVSAGRGARSTPGPGGGAGGTAAGPAHGCGPGGPAAKGATTITEDSGGGGGGGGLAGGAGGAGNTGSTTTPGGAAGLACLPATLEPLQGGSGGGVGGAGATGITPAGGGGGGVLQITALGTLEVTGTIHAGGAGGEAGAANGADAGSGGGGGSGGGILLEAPTVIVAGAAVIAANGGGGGASGTGAGAGNPGDNAHASLTPAAGGTSSTGGISGGSGGVAGAAAMTGGSNTMSTNGGGGGGAVGAIVIRGRVRMISGTTTPTATQSDVL